MIEIFRPHSDYNTNGCLRPGFDKLCTSMTHKMRMWLMSVVIHCYGSLVLWVILIVLGFIKSFPFSGRVREFLSFLSGEQILLFFPFILQFLLLPSFISYLPLHIISYIQSTVVSRQLIHILLSPLDVGWESSMIFDIFSLNSYEFRLYISLAALYPSC